MTNNFFVEYVETAKKNVYKYLRFIFRKDYDQEIAEAYDICISTASLRIKKAEDAVRLRKMSKGKRYEELDTGKLKALINAGWSLSKLADEFKRDRKEMDEIITEWIEDMKEAELWPEAL